MSYPQQTYDASESPSNIEGFDDEPHPNSDPYGQAQQHGGGVGMPQDDPYGQPQYASHQQQPHQQQQQYPQQQQPPREQPAARKHKYSTANMNESGKWKKYCSILALFLLFLAFMIGLSMLFNHFFFGDQSDNGPVEVHRSENETFSRDKSEVDAACSRGTFSMDQGELCKEACAPQFFECCDPFDEFNLYNYTEVFNGTNISVQAEEQKNVSFLADFNDFDSSTCSFDQDLRGCVAYAKCQALGGQVDPAPANLAAFCSFERLQLDDDGCKDICRKLDCCYSDGADNCMAEKFDLCMDYAPCQNLRSLERGGVLEAAPLTLDTDCFYQQPSCTEACEKARCCNDPNNSCFQDNFMTCLTYAPCNDVTEVSIVVEPQFNSVSKPPQELIYACNAHKENILHSTPKTCNDYCAEAACCWSDEPGKNCFQQDPLACLAWGAQCQVLLVDYPDE